MIWFFTTVEHYITYNANHNPKFIDFCIYLLPKIYTIYARKIFFPNFGSICPQYPASYAYAMHGLNFLSETGSNMSSKTDNSIDNNCKPHCNCMYIIQICDCQTVKDCSKVYVM